MSSNEIKALLLNKYCPPAYAFFTEVGSGTGSLGGRYADAVACSLYPSTGLEIQGFEIKTGRGDFLNEMKHPEKSAEVMQHCHRWWLVAPKGVAVADELPKSWGFFELSNGRFFKKKHAPELTPTENNRAFVASLLRRATEHTVPRETLWSKINLAREEAKKDFAKGIEEKEQKLKNYMEKVRVFEEASGISILHNYKGGKELGEAVRFVLDGGIDGLDWDVDGALRDSKEIVSKLQEFLRFKGSFKIKKL